MKFSNGHTSVTYDVSMTELQNSLEKLIPEKYRTPGFSITLSFHDSLTGQIVYLVLDTSGRTIQAKLSASSPILQSEVKFGEEPTS